MTLNKICHFRGTLIIWYLSARSIHSIYDPRPSLDWCLPTAQWVFRLPRYIQWGREAQSPQYWYSHRPIYTSSRLQQITATWFRFLIKQVAACEDFNQYDHKWYEMGFFTRWISPGGQIIFCFDVPQALHDSLGTHFLSPSTTLKLFDVYSLHVVIVDEIIELFDKSVRSLWHIVRVTELVVLSNYSTGKIKAVNNHFQNRLDAAQ